MIVYLTHTDHTEVNLVESCTICTPVVVNPLIKVDWLQFTKANE